MLYFKDNVIVLSLKPLNLSCYLNASRNVIYADKIINLGMIFLFFMLLEHLRPLLDCNLEYNLPG